MATNPRSRNSSIQLPRRYLEVLGMMAGTFEIPFAKSIVHVVYATCIVSGLPRSCGVTDAS